MFYGGAFDVAVIWDFVRSYILMQCALHALSFYFNTTTTTSNNNSKDVNNKLMMMMSNNRGLVTLAEHTSDHGKQTNKLKHLSLQHSLGHAWKCQGLIYALICCCCCHLDSVDELAAHVAECVVSRLHALLPPAIKVTASQCGSELWSKILSMFPMTVTLDRTCTAPCCLTTSTHADVQEFVWPSPNLEDAKDNIVSALKHLNTFLLPEGVLALPVQILGWLQGSFQFGSAGTLVIEQSKTDYIFVLERGWEEVSRMLDTKVQGHRLTNSSDLLPRLPHMLPFIIGFYEAKTPSSLTKNFNKCIAQAVLQYMAANQMRQRPGQHNV